MSLPRAIRSAALIALALVAAFTATAAAQDYPRLGLYWSIHRDGRPLLDANGNVDPVIASQVARYDQIVVDVDPLSPYRPDVLDELRRLHPGIRLMGYVTGHFIWPSADPDSLRHYPTRYWRKVRDLDGFLYNRQGAQFGLTNDALTNVNLAKKSGGRYVVAESLAVLFWDVVVREGKWDGVFLDAFCDNVEWTQAPGESIDYVRAGYASLAAFDAGWKAGTDTLAARLRQLSGATPVLVGNCGIGSKYAWFNGWMRENFPNQNGGTWYSNMTNTSGGYLNDDHLFRDPPDNFIFSGTAFPATPYVSENLRQLRFGLGSATLGDGYGVFGYIGRVTDLYPYWTWWFDEYAVDLATGRASTSGQHTGWLGQPLGPYYQMIWVGTAPDAVSNPSFETNVSGWTSFFVVPGGISRDSTTAAVGAASLRVQVGQAALTDYHVTVGSAGSLQLYAYNTYSATFWAKASSPRRIAVVANEPTIGEFARQYVWIDTEWRQYQVALVPRTSGSAKLQFYLGLDAGDVWIDDAHLQQGTTTLYRRDFANGAVLVNPGPTSLTVPLGTGWRRILGTVDPAVNDGSPADLLTVPSRDARFVIATERDTIPPAAIQDANVRP